MTTPHLRKSIGRAPLCRGFFLLALALACFALLPAARAVLPAPDGGYPNNTTAEGEDALFSLTTGFGNTAIGFDALYNNTTGYQNTAIGVEALFANTEGQTNVATGIRALYSNTTGHENVAFGGSALASNDEGEENTAIGDGALASSSGADSDNNTAVGSRALIGITSSFGNTAVGRNTGASLIDGADNTMLGYEAGINLVSGSFNIYINNAGVADDFRAIRIGDENQDLTFIAGIRDRTVVDGKPVVIDANGQLGTTDTSTSQDSPGTVRYMKAGFPIPAGFTKIGTYSISYKKLDGANTILQMSVCIKD